MKRPRRVKLPPRPHWVCPVCLHSFMVQLYCVSAVRLHHLKHCVPPSKEDGYWMQRPGHPGVVRKGSGTRL